MRNWRGEREVLAICGQVDGDSQVGLAGRLSANGDWAFGFGLEMGSGFSKRQLRFETFPKRVFFARNGEQRKNAKPPLVLLRREEISRRGFGSQHNLRLASSQLGVIAGGLGIGIVAQ